MAELEKNVDTSTEVEELKKQLAAAEKRAKAAEKKAEEAEKISSNGDKATPGKTIAQILAEEEKETIMLFKDDGKYKDDVYVCLNGMSYQIKRGEPVEVPKSVAELIKNSERQDREAAARLESLAQKAANASALM